MADIDKLRSSLKLAIHCERRAMRRLRLAQTLYGKRFDRVQALVDSIALAERIAAETANRLTKGFDHDDK